VLGSSIRPSSVGSLREDMSFREENEEGRDLRKPFLHTGSWYRMGSRQSSMLGSSQAIRESSISVVACVLIVALGPIQFGFTVSSFLNLSLSISLPVRSLEHDCKSTTTHCEKPLSLDCQTMKSALVKSK